jgi:hypothetical protein
MEEYGARRIYIYLVAENDTGSKGIEKGRGALKKFEATRNSAIESYDTTQR